MQTLDFNNFIEERVNKEKKEYILFNDILSSYTPDIKDYGWLAGGAIRRLISGQTLDSDFDFFFKSKEAFDEFYIGIKGDKNIKIVEELKTNTNLKLIVDVAETYKNIIFQLININYYNKVEDLLNSFDFTLCQLATDGESLYCGDLALWDIANKKIVINKITYPVASLRRMFKYANQGYYACNGALTKFLMEASSDPDKISENSLKYID